MRPAEPAAGPDQRSPVGVTIRPATRAEYDAAGALTVRAYRSAGFLHDDDGYATELADAADRAATTELLVAVDDRGEVVGNATLIYGPGSPYSELATDGDAELRMLAVDPDRQGGGVGAALVAECLHRAQQAGCRRFVLSSRPDMHAAHRLYERFGFRRAGHLDWEPVPGFTLIAYERPLGGEPGEPAAPYCSQCGGPRPGADHTPCERRAAYEPPRYCERCRRRMVVQVTPRGWTARCSEHGVRSG